jgi:two-component system heavy metal sensor histidine kinase CusS
MFSRSLRFRLALSFAAGSLGTLLVASGVLYWAFQHELNGRNQRLLDRKVQEVAEVLTQRPNDEGDLQEEVAGEVPPTGEPSFWIRVVRGPGRMLETPGMTERIPMVWFRGQVKTKHRGHRYLLREQRLGGQVIQAALDITEDERMIFGFRRRLLYTLLFGATACALFGWWAAHRGLSPLRAIADSTSGITPQRLQERLDPGRIPQELQDLVTALNGMLDRLDRAFVRLSRFSADLAHEFRTPINNLMGEAEVVLSQARSPEDYRQVLESSMEEFRRLSRLISRMLFLARAEDPHTTLTRTPIEASRLVEEVLAYFEAAAEEQGIRLTGQGQGSFLGDADLLRQALANLVTNALAATPQGGRVQVGVSRQPASVELWVKDTGRGIAPEDLPHLLDRFYRTQEAQDRKQAGTGLGLAIVQSIAHLHGGEITLTSQPGLGTTVRLAIQG